MSGNAGAMYFNEFDRYPAAWLRNLYPSATVDERSIADVGPNDVAGYDRCHWFAGIGGWEYALDLAGWPADRPVWTGSCPCQPFSAAGRGLGADDPRHLWPAFYRLIAERRPATVFGEQVGGAAGRAWLSAVRADLEAIGYAVGAADLCAAGVGAPHIRQRLYWVADLTANMMTGAGTSGRDGGMNLQSAASLSGWPTPCTPSGGRSAAGTSATGRTTDGRKQTVSLEHVVKFAGWGTPTAQDAKHATLSPSQAARDTGVLSSAVHLTGWPTPMAGSPATETYNEAGNNDFSRKVRAAPTARARCVERAGVRPLAHGVPARASKLRAYGNAIVPQVAAVFVRAFLDCEVAR